MKTLVSPIVILFASTLFFCACKKSDPKPAPPPTKPTITTNAVTNITATTATCGGFIGDSSTAYIFKGRGTVYSKVETAPTLLTNNTDFTSDYYATPYLWGSYPSYITNLTPNTTYYIRAVVVYQTNPPQDLYLYGEVRTFKTLP